MADVTITLPDAVLARVKHDAERDEELARRRGIAMFDVVPQSTRSLSALTLRCPAKRGLEGRGRPLRWPHGSRRALRALLTMRVGAAADPNTGRKSPD
ncbi:hypothetical protein CH341_30355 [Rhodoplanes roseus]|uniref:Uncharacterized protein n=1 Tax=Rhodoplanes roseus TaxID=29409 RepID=A0A327KM69_9BRAD|nr:hypothetical protein CH341_30355 [Rhodoplanes roseus]